MDTTLLESLLRDRKLTAEMIAEILERALSKAECDVIAKKLNVQ